MRKRIQELTILLIVTGLLTLCARSGMAQGAGANTASSPASAPKAIKKITTHRRMKRTNTARSRRDPNEPVSLWVVSKPSNSKVSADGQLQGETNADGELELQLTPGTHT